MLLSPIELHDTDEVRGKFGRVNGSKSRQCLSKIQKIRRIRHHRSFDMIFYTDMLDQLIRISLFNIPWQPQSHSLMSQKVAFIQSNL